MNANLDSEAIKETVDCFYLGSDCRDIVYGNSQVEYKGETILFSNQKLVSISDNTVKVITNTDGNNLNISDDKLYYSAFIDGKSYVYEYDLIKQKERKLLTVGNKEIVNLYVINDSVIKFLMGNQLYTYDLCSEDISCVCMPTDIINFMATKYGVFYAAGDPTDSTIMLSSQIIAKHVTYYSVESDRLIMTIDGNTYQMPLIEIVSLCEKAENNIYEKINTKEICTPQTMDVYDFYGSYSVFDIINLNNTCESCEKKTSDPNDSEIQESIDLKNENSTMITPNARQQAILNRGTAVVNLSWTPYNSFMSYKSVVPNNGPCDFIGGNTYVGLPYMLPGRIYDTGYTPVYIGFGTFWDNGTATTLSNFVSRVSDPNDYFNLFAASTYGQHGYGPLYGQDCSRFVSYAWGYSTANSTYDYGSDDKCVQLTSTSNNSYLTASDLALLLPGDAFVSYGNHAILVTAVYKNSNGVTTKVETMEETPPKAVKRTYLLGGSGQNSIQFLLQEKLAPSDAGYPYQIYRLKESVRFIPNLGTVNPLSIPIITGKTYGYYNNNSLPVPYRANYVFDGWYTSSTGGTLVTASTQVSNNSARKLYAHWHAVPVPDNEEIVQYEKPWRCILLQR